MLGELTMSLRYFVPKRVGGLNCHILVEKDRESAIRGTRAASPIFQSAASYLYGPRSKWAGRGRRTDRDQRDESASRCAVPSRASRNRCHRTSSRTRPSDWWCHRSSGGPPPGAESKVGRRSRRDRDPASAARTRSRRLRGG